MSDQASVQTNSKRQSRTSLHSNPLDLLPDLLVPGSKSEFDHKASPECTEFSRAHFKNVQANDTL